jgi:hypothetical protein
MTISGWFDMALTGGSYETNGTMDLFFAKEAVAWLVSNMLGESGDRRDPLRARFTRISRVGRRFTCRWALTRLCLLARPRDRVGCRRRKIHTPYPVP